jgi:tetratricopeptide (TPR) repeat protein
VAQQTRTDWSFSEQFEPDFFWQQYGKKIIYVVLALLAVGAFAYLRQRQQAEEADRMVQRLATATNPQALESIVHDYPGKPAAKEAILRLASMYAQTGHPTDAVSLYQRFLKDFPADPLAESVLLALANLEESQDNFAAAKAKYVELMTARPTGFTVASAKLGAARCAEALGQFKEARQFYEEVLASTREGSPLFEAAAIRSIVLRRDLLAAGPNTNVVAEPKSSTNRPPHELIVTNILIGPPTSK